MSLWIFPKRQKAVVTPIAMPANYLDLYSTLRTKPFPFILDSAQVSAEQGRYTFMGSNPFLVLQSKGNRVELWQEGKKRVQRTHPFDLLQELLSLYRLEPQAQTLPFLCGAVGYLGYDLNHWLEKLPSTAEDDLPFHEMFWAFYDRILAVDHQAKKAYLVELFERAPKRSLENFESPESLEGLRSSGSATPELPKLPKLSKLQSNFTKEAYLAAIARAKEYIAAGDIYQVNLSQRFQTTCALSPYEVFLRLREKSPASYAALLELGTQAVVSSSPELFLRVDRRHVVTRPIKGTRPRGADASADERLKRELLESPKDDAELAMIIDLERNDLGKVCAYGSVEVTQKKMLETYPTLHHLCAQVEGTLRKEVSSVELMKAVFPGGSVTGAPKIRAMEIIDELEPTRRSVYTGAMGYISFDGTMRLNVAIRTLLLSQRRAYFQAGGAIVADSDPEAEYQETLVKARGFFEALELHSNHKLLNITIT